MRRLILSLVLIALLSPLAEAGHAPVYALDGEKIVCTVTNVKQEPTGRVLAVTAAHCLHPGRQFDEVLGTWQETNTYAPFNILVPLSGEVLGTGSVVARQGDLGLIAYVPHKPVLILPYRRFDPTEMKFGQFIGACGVIVDRQSEPHLQGLCMPGFWLNDVIQYDKLDFWAIQVPVKSGMSGGAILYGGRVIGIYSIQIIGGSVAGMTPINAAIPYLEKD
mgnify:CR=1 FL=1